MDVNDADICALTESIWRETLGFDVLVDPTAVGEASQGRVISSAVRFDGAWRGEVRLDCSADVARRAAAAMLAMPVGQVSLAEIEDVVGELANMTGGNIKALLPGVSVLSLPAANGAAPTPGSRSIKLGFRHDGGAFVITLTDVAPNHASNEVQ